MLKSPKIAFVYDRVNTKYGGAEHVLTALHERFPDAPLFTAVYDPETATWAKDFVVQPSFLQRFPFAKSFHRQYVGLMPLAFESFELDEYDVVISITSAEAKGVLTKPHQLHLCYLLTPTRYLWSHPDEYTQPWLLELIKKPLFNYLRWWDQAAAKRPDTFIPISKRVAERCKTFYDRQAGPVIYPPVAVSHFTTEQEALPKALADQGIKPNEYYLIVARLVGYKKIDVAVKACAQTGRPLVIIGDGPDYNKLQHLKSSLTATTPIVTVKSVQSDQLAAYYKNCRAFLAPGEEDFGIAAIEAHACGKPAILHSNSGNAEVSPDRLASIHLNQSTVAEVIKALDACEKRSWDVDKIRACAVACRTETFQAQFHERVMEEWQQFSER